MVKDVQERKTDITDIELVSGEPPACPVNDFDHKSEEEIRNIEVPPLSKRHRIRMNRLFRERVGGSFLPFPEEDTVYEKVRSFFVVKFKINEFSDRRKKCRRRK